MRIINLSKYSGTIVLATVAAIIIAGLTSGASTLRADALAEPLRQNLIGWTGMTFQTMRHGNWEIYLDGPPNGEVRLTNHGAADTLPRLNRGGTKIVFVSNRDGNHEIYTMNSDGTAQTRLTNNGATDTGPQWSPDGRQIIFMSSRTGNGDLYLMNADGSNQRILIQDGNEDNYPTWSPDGSQILWIRRYPKERNQPQYGEVWRANADGTSAQAITGLLATPARPVVSPDGAKVAFDADWNGDGYPDVVWGDTNGSNLGILLHSAPSQHWWMGTWTLDSNAIFVTELNYAFDGTNVGGLVSTYIRQRCLYQEAGCSNMAIDSTAMMPDVQSLDLAAPVSQVDPLPAWSRLHGFTVQWTGRDSGRSGLYGYEVEYRPAATRDWALWYNGINPGPALPIPPATETRSETFVPPAVGVYYFRSRAIDQAQNLEPWPATENGDATTTVFSWLLTGQVTDNRGLPQTGYTVPLAPAALNNATTDAQGNFQLHIGAPGNYTLADEIRLSMMQDQQRSYYLLPRETILENGSFERPLAESRWQISGTVSTLSGNRGVHSGQRAVQIGRSCPDTCTVELPLEATTGLDSPYLFSTPDGNLHLFAHKSPGTLIHQVRTVAGNWLPYTVLANGIYSWTPAMQVDEHGNIHLVWDAYDFSLQHHLYYAQYQAAGGWTQPTALGRGMAPRIALEANQQLHLVYQCDEVTVCPDATLYYRTLATNGSWTAPTPLATGLALRGYDIGFNAGTVYVSWGIWPALERAEALQIRSTRDGQMWSAPTTIETRTPPEGGTLYTPLYLRNDGDRLHLLWNTAGTTEIFYSMKSRQGGWSAIEQLQAEAGVVSYPRLYLLTDAEHALHLFADGDHTTYWHRVADQWNTPRTLTLHNDSEEFLRDVTLDLHGDFYFAFDDFTPQIALKTTAKVETPEQSSLAQSVHIGSTLHQPTLSFLYQLTGGDVNGHSGFTLSVSQGMTTTELLSTSVTTDWQLGWVDMTPWQGETVTVTVAVNQAAGDPYLQVVLDQMALGPWRTPLPQRVEPNRIDSGKATMVTIHGQNFVEAPQIWIGERSVAVVTWIDEQTLTATLPADLPPGIYPLTVENTTGERYQLNAALAVGKQIYLPVVE